MLQFDQSLTTPPPQESGFTVPTESKDTETTMERGEAFLDTYTPLVHEIVKKIARTMPPWIDTESLLQSGMVGLLDAARRYEPRRGIPFGAYARHRIYGEIQDYLRTLDVGSRSIRVWGRELAAARARCRARYGDEGGAEEMAAALGVPLERYYHLDRRVSEAAMVSVEEPAVAAATEQTLLATLEGLHPWLDPALLIESRDLVRKLTAAVAQLTERERLILTLYYYEELTLREIGAVVTLTEGRVSQILAKVTADLRQALLDEATLSPLRPRDPRARQQHTRTRAAREDGGR